MNATIVTNHMKQDAAQIISLTPGLSSVAKRWPDALAVFNGFLRGMREHAERR